jgi:Fur family ferric uptake transcriptional regulator
MREAYNTKTKQLVLEEVKSLNSFTANDIFKSLDNKNMHVGLTTIYRSLEDLENKGIITKYFDDSKKAYYKLIENCQSVVHFYLKCVKCNKIEHVDCECIEEFKAHILNKHKFNANFENIVITGLCNKCRSFISVR